MDYEQLKKLYMQWNGQVFLCVGPVIDVVTEDDKTYYLLPSGICAVGTVDISHVDENGNTVTETYVFDEEGVLIGKA
jgi:hypothetical protein